MKTPLLKVEDLKVQFRTRDETVRAVNGVDFTISAGETVGIVGESGSGKTVTVLSILGLIPSPPGEVTKGRAMFGDVDLLQLDEDELREIRGREIAMVFQDPMTSLNPVHRVGEQIREARWAHNKSIPDSVHRDEAIRLLDLVGTPQAARRYDQFPHEFSGGMRQRAMIAMAIANRPKLLIADEPTTALDVTIQAQVIDVLLEAKEETGAATVLITHDLGLVAEIADRVLVMYAGQIVEQGPIQDIFQSPSHPYTIGLLSSLPTVEERRSRLSSIPGRPPDLSLPTHGCPFRVRCAVSDGRALCSDENPALRELSPLHSAACHFIDDAVAWSGSREQDPGVEG